MSRSLFTHRLCAQLLARYPTDTLGKFFLQSFATELCEKHPELCKVLENEPDGSVWLNGIGKTVCVLKRTETLDWVAYVGIHPNHPWLVEANKLVGNPNPAGDPLQFLLSTGESPYSNKICEAGNGLALYMKSLIPQEKLGNHYISYLSPDLPNSQIATALTGGEISTAACVEPFDWLQEAYGRDYDDHAWIGFATYEPLAGIYSFQNDKLIKNPLPFLDAVGLVGTVAACSAKADSHPAHTFSVEYLHRMVMSLSASGGSLN